MKRSISDLSAESSGESKNKKKKSMRDEEEEISGIMNLDENLIFEILKHIGDARTLGVAACVSRLWNRTATDERLWELICTRQWTNSRFGVGSGQLRSVVTALGGFRRLHALYLWPLSKPQPPSAAAESSSSSSSSAPTVSSPWSSFPSITGSKPPTKLGKDEVHLSLSLLSIRYYEKMNFGDKIR